MRGISMAIINRFASQMPMHRHRTVCFSLFVPGTILSLGRPNMPRNNHTQHERNKKQVSVLRPHFNVRDHVCHARRVPAQTHDALHTHTFQRAEGGAYALTLCTCSTTTCRGVA